MRRALLLTLLTLLTLGCGAPPPTLSEQRGALELRTPRDAGGWATLGWWRYLDGDAAGAAEAFSRAPKDPLAALGLGRLAADALAPARALAALDAAPSRSPLAEAWRRRWRTEVPPGARPPPKEATVPGARHTLRISSLPRLDLRRLRRHPPRLEPDGLHALGKRWALHEAAPRADADGLVVSVWPLPEGPARLALEMAGPALAVRGGRIVLATDPLRPAPPGRVRFTAPGRGPLLLVWAAPRAPTLRPQGASPTTLSLRSMGPAVRGRGPSVDWVARALGVWLAVEDRDPEEAQRLLEGAPSGAAFAGLRARLAAINPALSGRGARDEARAQWEAARPLAPPLAELALAALSHAAGEDEAALRHLDEVARRAPRAWPMLRARVEVLGRLGRGLAARSTLAQMEALSADRCALVDARLALSDDRSPTEAAAITEDLAGCGRALDATARALDQNLPGRALRYLEAWRETHAGDLGGGRARGLRARALIGLGRMKMAAEALSGAKGYEQRLLRADLMGRDLRGLEALVDDSATGHGALDLMATWPRLSPLSSLRIDTEAAIAAYEARAPQAGPAARVLDHSASVYFADGTSLRRVHEVLAIRSREAAETYGELGVPEDARLLTLYTRKADGRRLWAEESPEKDTISLPDLKIGDYVVASYLVPGDNGYLYDSGYLTPRIYFQGVDLPIFRQRFEIYGPKGWPPRAQVLHGGPEPQRVTLGTWPGLRLETTRAPLWPPEAGAPPPGTWLPSARAGHGVALAEDLAYVRDRALAARRHSGGFDRWVRRSAGAGELMTRLRRISRAVRGAVDGELGLTASDVDAARLSGSGNRALVLSAALEVLGVEHRLLLTRPAVHTPSGPFLSVADFPYPLIETPAGWLDPGPDRAPVGWIPFPMLGGDAVQVWPPEAEAAPQALPKTRAVRDHREIRATLHWAADGTLTGEVVDTLEGQEAVVVGAHMARLSPELRPKLVERLLVDVVGAARVDGLQDLDAQAPDGPLVLRYHLRARAEGELRLGLFPQSPGRRYAGRAARTTPLEVSLPTEQVVRLRVTSERPMTLETQAGEREDGARRFTLRAEQIDGEEVEVVATLKIPGGLIQPSEYPGFARWARAVDGAERIRLRRPPGDGSDLAQR